MLRYEANMLKANGFLHFAALATTIGESDSYKPLGSVSRNLTPERLQHLYLCTMLLKINRKAIHGANIAYFLLAEGWLPAQPDKGSIRKCGL